MSRTWVLETGTKGTGANVVPLENVEKTADARPKRAARAATPAAARSEQAAKPRRARAGRPVRTVATALPPGHVRKKTTGEIGRVGSIDQRAGTVVVHWLKSGGTSTVPLSAVTRH